MAKDCRAKPTVAFPWSNEDLVKAWQLTYGNTETPERTTVCEKMKEDETLYKNLLYKVKRRKDAENELRAQKETEKAQKSETAAQKKAEQEAARQSREQKRREKEQRQQQQTVSGPAARAATLDPWSEPDLVPFSAEVLAQARSQIPADAPDFWSQLYRQFASQMVPRLARMDDIRDLASDAVPTAEFPWSTPQLGQARNLGAHEFRHNADFRRTLAALSPAYNFLLMDQLYESADLLDMAIRSPFSPYIPWQPAHIRHFLQALTPEQDLPDDMAVRVALVRHWRVNLLLQQYVSNLTPVLVSQMSWLRVAPFGTLVLTYATWDVEGKEFELDRLHNLWANDIIMRTYELQRVSHGKGSTSYYDLLEDLVHDTAHYKLIHTPGGLFLLKAPQELAQLRLQDLPLDEFRPPAPLKWNKASVVRQALSLLNKAKAEHQAGAAPAAATGPDDDAEINTHKGTTATVRALRQVIRGYFVKLQLFMQGIELFLTTLFLKNEGFRLHTSVFAGNLASLRALYVQAQGRSFDPKTKVSKATVREWALENRPAGAVPAFQQDIRTSVYATVPPLLADSAKRFQQFVDDAWSHLRLPPVTAEPPASTCAEDQNASGTDRRFLQPDNAQLFLNAEFNPGSFENGKIVVHSVGSGKTCLAIRIASDFARAGFRIVWVTKHALRHQVLKNHVSEICNLLIREQYDRLQILEGKDAADAWLRDKIPSQTNFSDVLRTLKGLGMDWTNLSYRQFSNALEPEPRNELGRKWRKEAWTTAFEQGAQHLDPLRKTLVIVDEAHKMFTGELDRTELPHVPAIHQALQHSYNASGAQRCRVLFLTATPTTDSMLPLLSMLNMLHYSDAFPYNMATIDPHVTTDEGLLQHIHEVRQQNAATELKVACDMFPKGLRLCSGDRGGAAAAADEDAEEPTDAAAYFDAKAILSGNTFKPHELTNHLQEFWSRAFGLISYYNISADYSKFPRTEYARIVMPSATLFQERLMASELLSSQKDLSSQAKKIRQIAAWARFETVGKESRKPDALDRVILEENHRTTFFEPTVDDLRLRRDEVLRAIEAERTSEPDPQDREALEFNRSALKNVQLHIQAKLIELSDLATDEHGQVTSRKTKGQAQREGAITRAIRKLQTQASGLEAEITRLEGNIQFHNSLRQIKLQYHEKRLKRIDQHLERLEKREQRRSRRHNTHGITEFLQRVNEQPERLEEEEEEEEAAAAPRRPRRNPKQKKKKNEDAVSDDDNETEAEAEDEEEAYEEEVRAEEKVEEKIKGEYYVKKSWLIVKDQLPTDQPKHPKRHYFDQPDTFDREQFLRDLPLYSPKADKFLRMIEADDQDCLKHNPEEEKHLRLRKRLVFCEDIHDIRAAAGALLASGWTWGQKRTWVKWQKEFFSTETNKKVGKTLTSTVQQLTWLPSREEGEDYKRFLVLTRSRLGGVSGGTLNDYAIQLMGAKGSEATYNHLRNLRGQDYRVIFIDRNFIEGIDLPSTYCDLYDTVLSSSNRTQIVGRISRFCGNDGLPFVPNFGWPQRVYRYDLKFHTVGLHLSEAQWERLAEKVHDTDGPYARIIPPQYLDGFLEKIEKNLFSPTELQILLDGNMELQRIRKKTLDVYEALMEKVSIGALLYAPAMRNLAVARHELDELLQEEEETAHEYRREIFAQDEQRRTKTNYQLRSLDQLKRRWQIHDNLLLSMLQHHVKSALRNTAPELVSRWQDPVVVKNFFERYVKPDMQNAELVGTSEDHALSVLTGMFGEAVNARLERQTQARHKASRHQAQRAAKAERARDKLVAHLLHVAKGPHKSWKHVQPDELWAKVHAQNDTIDRATFDRVLRQKQEATPRSRHKPTEPRGSRVKGGSRHPGRSALRALLAVKKAYSMDKRRVQTSTEQQEQLVTGTMAAHPGVFSREQVEAALKEWLSSKGQ